MADRLFDVVNVLVFNRPDYTRRTLASLAVQSDAFAGAEIHVWADGYTGSQDQEIGRPDLTGEVLAAVRELLPGATVHTHATNQGIAQIYDAAERLALARSAAPYVLFFEDDLVLGPDYMEAMSQLMTWGLAHDEVAIVTAHGHVNEYLTGQTPVPPVDDGPRFVHSLWGYAVKTAHLRRTAPFAAEYLRIIRRFRYHERHDHDIRFLFARHGVTVVHGTSQDYAKHVALLSTGRFAVTLPVRLATYVGQVGQHTTVGAFAALGYADAPAHPFDPDDYRARLARPVDWRHLLTVRLLELQAIRARFFVEEIGKQTETIEQLSRRTLSFHLQRLAMRTPLLQTRLIAERMVRKYRAMLRRAPGDLTRPTGFNERVLHRIIHDRDRRLKILCDKVAAKAFATERVGRDAIVPTLGVWRRADAIDWAALPERFVLKPTHSSGFVALVRSAADRDTERLTRQAARWLRHDYFDLSFEWGYRGIPRRLIAEPLLIGPDGGTPMEVLAFVFGGRLKLMRILHGQRATPAECCDWIDPSGRPLAIGSRVPTVALPLASAHRAEIIRLAEAIAAGFTMLRVDFYITDVGIRVGELTPYSNSGCLLWDPPELNTVLGRLWEPDFDPALLPGREPPAGTAPALLQQAADRANPDPALASPVH
ncbi:MAG: glycosyltransferase [Rhodovulum sp.]|nr:glycosyltransferase [Rhodovulum sp.]